MINGEASWCIGLIYAPKTRVQYKGVSVWKNEKNDSLQVDVRFQVQSGKKSLFSNNEFKGWALKTLWPSLRAVM